MLDLPLLNLPLIKSNVQKIHGNRCVRNPFLQKMGGIGYAPILLCITVVLIVLFINSILASPAFTKVTAVVGLWGWIAVTLAVISLLFFYRCSSKNPGFIEGSTQGLLNLNHADQSLINMELEGNSLWTGNWSQLCPTCKIIRPVRSKHCSTCKRCVEQFDHHCPWISNCVGKRNKWDFFVFISLGTCTTFIAAAVTIQRIWTEVVLPPANSGFYYITVHHPGAVAFLFFDLVLLAFGTALTVSQASQIARNVTTNELANASRYSYLSGPDGRFLNPYNHGIRKNCTDFLIYGHTDDGEVWVPLQHNTR